MHINFKLDMFCFWTDKIIFKINKYFKNIQTRKLTSSPRNDRLSPEAEEFSPSKFPEYWTSDSGWLHSSEHRRGQEQRVETRT